MLDYNSESPSTNRKDGLQDVKIAIGVSKQSMQLVWQVPKTVVSMNKSKYEPTKFYC